MWWYEEPIHFDVEVVKQQLEAHKVRVATSSSNCFCPSSIPFLSLGSNQRRAAKVDLC